ncbi:MAG: hypothetical protein V1826_01325 [bacterium]
MKKAVFITITVLVVIAVGLLLAYQLGKKAPGVYAIQDGKIYKLDTTIEFTEDLVFKLPPDYPKLKANQPFKVEIWDSVKLGEVCLIAHGFTKDTTDGQVSWRGGSSNPPGFVFSDKAYPGEGYFPDESSLAAADAFGKQGEWRVRTSDWLHINSIHQWQWTRNEQPFPYYRLGFCWRPCYDKGIPPGVYVSPLWSSYLLVPIVFR